jgi:hypothetical protein
MALITSLPLTKTAQVHTTLTALLKGMFASPPPAVSYLQVLELARAPLAFVQDELSARYAQRSLVPGSSDEETLAKVAELWRLMAQAYAQVASLGGDSSDIQNRLALICHRCVHYAGRRITEYYRARREAPKGLWSELYGYYSSAEEWQIAGIPVAEPLSEYIQSHTCSQALAAVLLVDLGNPYGRSARELEWLTRWGQRFSVFADVKPVDEQCEGQLYAVDLNQDRGPRPLELLERTPEVRRLDASRLADEMHRVAAQLKAGVQPAELGLGEKAFEPAAGKLLVSLFRPWCLAATPRRFQRRKAQGQAEICFGFEPIHYFIGGVEFVQPAKVRMFSRSEFETIVTFRHQVDPRERLHVKTTQIEYDTEKWEVLDQSVNGFRAQRTGKGERLEHAQLVGFRPPDGEAFMICEVSWLMYLRDGTLQVGLHVLPGSPMAVAVRPSGAAVSHSERYVRAFLLPELPALKEPASLVLPKGWYQPERVLDIHTDRSHEVRLEEILTQGWDFERVRFEPLYQAEQVEPVPDSPENAR